MKKIFALMLSGAFVFTSAAQVLAVQSAPTSSTVIVNGENVSFEAYLIEGNNYFKLRDLAYALNGTSCQFEVGYDSTAKAVSLTSKTPYTPVGGELSAGSNTAKEAAPTTSTIIKDGQEISPAAYLIDGNNYFKLRDIGAQFGFEVDWDASANAVIINTPKAAEKPAAPEISKKKYLYVPDIEEPSAEGVSSKVVEDMSEYLDSFNEYYTMADNFFKAASEADFDTLDSLQSKINAKSSNINALINELNELKNDTDIPEKDMEYINDVLSYGTNVFNTAGDMIKSFTDMVSLYE